MIKKLLFKYYNYNPIVKTLVPHCSFKFYVFCRDDMLVNIYLFRFFRICTITFGDLVRLIECFKFSDVKFVFLNIDNYESFLKYKRRIGL